uniref:ZP domain-containing protein n=1 Tax=Leptobrachium leishanense TaxID=445787 RepID=A0A8C5MJF9_9ANUR
MSFPLLLLLIISAQRCIGDTFCRNEYQRLPENRDLSVTCGPSVILLSIKACPVWYANYEPLQLALNGKHNMSQCFGTLDNSTGDPVMNFTLAVDNTSGNTCGNVLQIIQGSGSGVFSDYSSVETVVISGYVDSPLLSENGIVTFSTNLHYAFSCRYPLQYLLNNTQLLTSFGAVAVNSNNGSFISTLRMQVYTTDRFTSPLSNGAILPLKQKIFVQVALNNTATSFNVLLDHCFATPSPILTQTTLPSEKYSFFTGCTVANKTSVILNGRNVFAQFSFETFRFVQHSTQPTSSIYVHCMTRLCQPDQCLQIINSCSGRRKRSTTYESTMEPVTVSTGPIYTSDKASDSSSSSSSSSSGALQESQNLSGSLTGLIIGLVLAAILGIIIVFGSLQLYKTYRNKQSA